MIRFPRKRATLVSAIALGAAAVASGCGSSYRPTDTSGSDASTGDGAADGTTTDGGADASACAADVTTDPKNCGRCGHDCLGATCVSGMCSAVQLAAPGGALSRIVASGSSLFVSTITTDFTEVSGLFRVSTTGGVPEKYAPQRHAEAMAVLGDTLFFAVDDPSPNPIGDAGGLYSCPLVGPAPCSPTLIAAANSPSAVTVDQGRVFYNEKASAALMVYQPPGPPTAFRSNITTAIGDANNLYVDGDDAFFSVSVLGPPFPQTARTLEILPTGALFDAYAYASPLASDGRMFGASDAVFVTAFERGSTPAGIVRRIPRGGGAPCDLGGTLNARPFGIHADASNVYWANQGTGAAPPYTNGSVAFCARTGCCTKPTVLWTGPTQPTALTGDAEAIYFTTHSGSIWKVAKP